MKDKKEAANLQKNFENLDDQENTNEEFPVFDFSIPKASSSEIQDSGGSTRTSDEGDDFTLDARQQNAETDSEAPENSTFGQLQFIKRHIDNLWRELEQIVSNADLLEKKQEKFNKQQNRRNNWLLIVAVIGVIGVSVLAWLILNQDQSLVRYIQGTPEVLVLNDEQWHTKVEQLQQQLNAMQAVQTQINGNNDRLQSRVAKLQEQLVKFQVQPLAPPIIQADQPLKSNISLDSGRMKIPEATKWIVSLASFEKELDAKQKALDFIAKGIPAIVSPVEVNSKTWYRIIVEGFKNKQESLMYAQNAKERLNLDSAWIARVR